RSGGPGEGHQQLDQALRIVDVGRAAGPIPAGHLELAGQSEPESPPLPWLVADAAVALADLEDRDIGRAPSAVRRDDLGEAADERLAQDRVVARERVRARDRSALA